MQTEPGGGAVGCFDHMDVLQARDAGQGLGEALDAPVPPVEGIREEQRQVEHHIVGHRPSGP